MNGCETHVSSDNEVEKVYMIIQRIFDTSGDGERARYDVSKGYSEYKSMDKQFANKCRMCKEL